MADLIPIGQFSQLTGLTVRALRLYDRRHLLSPAVVDFASGYRYYNQEQIAEARRIQLLRSLRMSLADIAVMLETHDPGTIETRLGRHREQLAKRVWDYERALGGFPTVDEWCSSARKDSTMEDNNVTHRCSFCRKGEKEVRRMIAGSKGVIICNECVDLCNEIITREEAQEVSSS